MVILEGTRYFFSLTRIKISRSLTFQNLQCYFSATLIVRLTQFRFCIRSVCCKLQKVNSWSHFSQQRSTHIFGRVLLRNQTLRTIRQHAHLTVMFFMFVLPIIAVTAIFGLQSHLISNELHKIIFKSTTFLIQFLNDELLTKAEGFLRHQSEYVNISRRAVLILSVNHSKSRQLS